MATKAQHAVAYQRLPEFLKTLREEAGLTQRALGKLIRKPQSYVYNCETGNRRVDVSEFIAWSKGCEVDALDAFRRFLKEL